MSEFVTIARVGEIPAGEGRTYAVEGRMVAVFLDQGSYFAMDDACPHMGASLGAGYVEEGAISCPWHAWRFCVKDGSWLDNPKSKIRSRPYVVRVQDDQIQVQLESPQKTE
ncbi:Rieske (2Fe-2S) protein [Planctomicrobium sp. SH664]|uniref:Rieske (2Fe-2S) protein n=1 Tax=Planctomicrobium sp. SH664 TaxID=3448125 RepID=UPI003F5B87AB